MEVKQKGISLNDLDATKASDQAFEFEYIKPNGDNSGIFLSVLGAQSDEITKEVARLVNERRRKNAARAINSKIGTSAKNVVFDTFESDVEFGQTLAAVRLVGWRGISDPWSKENAMRLCKTNREISAQIMEHSEAVENFIKV